MKVKKILSMLCAVSALSLGGCSGDLYEEDNIAEEASSDSAQTTEIKSDEKDKTGKTDIGVSVSLDQNGVLNIQRNTAASVPMGDSGTWTIFFSFAEQTLKATVDLLHTIYRKCLTLLQAAMSGL